MILQITKDSHPEIFERLYHFYIDDSQQHYNSGDYFEVKSIISIKNVDKYDKECFPNTNFDELEGYWESNMYRTIGEHLGELTKDKVYEFNKVERREIPVFTIVYKPITTDEVQN